MDRNKEFSGKVALVTGAGSGIGLAVATLLADLGAVVAVADIDLAAARRTVADLKEAGGNAVAFHVDVADPASFEALTRMCVDTLGGLHLAVNNAGIAGPRVPMHEYPLDAWRRVVDVDLSGVFYALRCQIPVMRGAGGGAIVNIASVAGGVGIVNTAPYAAAKHGVVGLTRTAALENAAHGIRVNAVGPGYVETPLLAGRGEETIRQYAARHPVGRLAQTGEIAEVVAFLLSGRASFVTGAYYLADGGFTAQ